jgi:translation elongation factor EF-1beta
MPAKEPSAYKRVVTWAVVAADAEADYKKLETQVKAIQINGTAERS